VDDTDLCILGSHVYRQSVRDEMQCSVDHWEGLLQATGGALVPTKCFWYLINFRFTNNKWMYANKSHHPGKITIKDDRQNWVAIPRLETNKACRMLGVHLAPDGNWEMELQYLLSVMSDWKVHMAVARLTPSDAMFSLKNVVLRKVNYPLVTTTFSCHQCAQVMSPILQQGLPKVGVIRTFPRALAHGPLDYGGLDIPHLYLEQIIAHIHTIL